MLVQPEVLVVAKEGVRAAGEVRPGVVPAFAAFDDQLVPRDPAAPRLVAVGNEPCDPVARFLRGDGKGVGAGHRPVLTHRQRVEGVAGLLRGFGFLANRRAGHAGAILARGYGGAEFGMQVFARHQRSDHVVQAEEERLAQRKAGRDILAVHGEKIGQFQLSGMFLGVLVEAGGVGFEQRAGIGRQGVIMAVRRAARVEQVIDVVDLRTFLTRNRAVTTARHRDHVLQGEEIVLGVGDRDAVSDIGIRFAVDMRHTEFAADDFGGVAVVARRRFGRLGEERFPTSSAR